MELAHAVAEHDAFAELLTGLGVCVHELGMETGLPDLVYQLDPLLVTDRGAIPLRSGKPNRRGEEAALEAWTSAHGILTPGRIEAPGTVDGGDTFWLRPDLFCVGRSLRTNRAGAAQLAALVGGRVEVFDIAYDAGPDERLHLLSVISPVADDLAVVYLPRLPAGLYALLRELGIRLIHVPADEFPSLGCNVLAVRPGEVVIAEGNRTTTRLLREAGCEVHEYAAQEVGVNGSGGPTCLARPILRG